MQIVSQEISAWVSTVAIKDTEESAFGPVFAFLRGWFHYVQNDGDSIFIVISNDSLVCVCSISRYNSILSHRALSLLEVRELDCVWIWIRGISKEQCIDVCNISRLWTWVTVMDILLHCWLHRLRLTLKTYSGTVTLSDPIRKCVFYFIVRQRSEAVLRYLSTRVGLPPSNALLWLV